MPRKRRISATQVVRDIRTGISEQELQKKHNIAPHKVEKLFKRLVAINAITKSELAERYPAYQGAITGIKEFRNRRADLPVQLIVYDVTTSSLGLLRDISETGLRVAGINCKEGDARSFQLPVETFMRADPLLVAAKCRWVKNRGKSMRYSTAGFEITDISDKDRGVLRRFVASLSFTNSRDFQSHSLAKETAAESIAVDQNDAVDDGEPSLCTLENETALWLPSWFDDEAMKALQEIYRSGALQEILAWWEAQKNC